MKLLIHTCCAPCLIAPYTDLKEKYDITAYWYNDNIHPFTEYEKRFLTLKEWGRAEAVDIIFEDSYYPEKFMQRISGREEERCFFCYYNRLKKTAQKAKEKGFDYFTTTLLYSIYQNHELLKSLGEEFAQKYEVRFLYQDFRKYWKQGIEMSKEREMYRQAYCGCLYSEKERYEKRHKRLISEE